MTQEHDCKQQLREQVKFIADQISDPSKIEVDTEDGEEMDAGSYIAQALNLEYYMASDGSYLGARILVAFGGPNIWVDTRTNTVEGTWWGDYAEASFEDNLGLDAYCEELFDMVKG